MSLPSRGRTPQFPPSIEAAGDVVPQLKAMALVSVQASCDLGPLSGRCVSGGPGDVETSPADSFTWICERNGMVGRRTPCLLLADFDTPETRNESNTGPSLRDSFLFGDRPAGCVCVAK